MFLYCLAAVTYCYSAPLLWLKNEEKEKKGHKVSSRKSNIFQLEFREWKTDARKTNRTHGGKEKEQIIYNNIKRIVALNWWFIGSTHLACFD